MRYVIRIVAISVVLLATSSSMWSGPYEIDKTYFYDSAFTIYGGSQDLYCDGSMWDTGPTATYRIIDVYRCNDMSQFQHYCQEKLPDGSWSPVTCPY